MTGISRRAVSSNAAGRAIAALVVPSRTYVMAGRPAELDLERLEGAAEGVASLGLDVVRTAGPWRNWKRYGGTDAERTAELQAALADPDVDLVLPVRGGCGMMRVLPGLDWKTIARRQPLAMGFSDFTAFNMALLARTGLPSWQGPMAGGLAPGHSTAASKRSFLRALALPGWAAQWDAGRADGVAPGEGRAAGLLWGGNLSMIVSLLGTPWFPAPKLVRGGILYLEDVGEASYRIDRMLLQLEAAGVLASQRAVVFGAFTGADRAAAPDGDLRLPDVLSDMASRLSRQGVLCAAGLPFGHIDELMALPFGVPGSLEISGGAARLSAPAAPVLGRGRERLLAALSSLEAQQPRGEAAS